MLFEYPAFLFALLVLVIPVIVHLFNFRRYKKLYFSNVQFLKQVDEQQAAAQNIKERLILFCRLLGLLFLVFAFAKPYFKSKNDLAPGQKQAVSIFVDNSNSMQAIGNEGSLLDEAKIRAKQIAAGYDLNTKFQLLTQDLLGKDQQLLNRAEFNNNVDEITLSAQSHSLSTIMNRQQSLLNTANNAATSVYVISDFQNGMLDGHQLKNTPTKINLVQLRANNLPNVAIDSVWFSRATHKQGEVEKLVFKLHNYADERAINTPLKLFINNKQKALGSYTVKANSLVTDTLSFSGLQQGWQQAELRLQDNPVTFDNVFHFSFYVADRMPVLLVNGDIENPFVKAAFDSESFFKPATVSFGNINYSELKNYPLIVVSDVRAISTGLAQQLQSYVEKGGNLVIFPALDIDINSYKDFLQSVNAAYFGKKVIDTTKVSVLNLNAEIYKNTFENMPQNPDLPKVNAYYPLNNGNANGEKLMVLQNGDPFWEQFNYNLGKVYVCTVPLDEHFSNLPRHALFLTTMLRIGISSGREQQLYHQIGSDQPITINNSATPGVDDVFKLTLDKQQIIPDVRNRDGIPTLYLSGQQIKPGTYQLSKKDSLVQFVSFNSNNKESNMHYAKQPDLVKLAGDNGRVLTHNTGISKINTDSQNGGFQLWKLCLLLTLIFLGAETLLIRFYKPRSALTS